MEGIPQYTGETPEDAPEEQETSQSTNKGGGTMSKLKGILRRSAYGAVIAASMAGAPGCEDKTPSGEKGPVSAGQAEKGEHTLEEKKETLQKAFRMIAGDRIAKAKDGSGLVIHIGGPDYYELEDADLNDLAESVDRYVTKGDRDPRIQQVRDKAMRASVTAKIIEVGKKLAIDDLPDSLVEFEVERRKVAEEMKRGE